MTIQIEGWQFVNGFMRWSDVNVDFWVLQIGLMKPTSTLMIMSIDTIVFTGLKIILNRKDYKIFWCKFGLWFLLKGTTWIFPILRYCNCRKLPNSASILHYFPPFVYYTVMAIFNSNKMAPRRTIIGTYEHTWISNFQVQWTEHSCPMVFPAHSLHLIPLYFFLWGTM